MDSGGGGVVAMTSGQSILVGRGAAQVESVTS